MGTIVLEVHQGSLLIRLNQIYPKHPVFRETTYLSAAQMNLPIKTSKQTKNPTQLLAPMRLKKQWLRCPRCWRNTLMAF